jgi:hypothetical protein
MLKDNANLILILSTGDQQWMPKPNGGNCPPGLEYLTQVDQILVHQMVEILESR